MKQDFFQKNRCAIPLIFLLVYGIPLLYLFINNSLTLLFIAKLAGLIAFLNVFTQVMLGALRDFFKKHYNPLKVYKFHNYLGLATLILSLIHVVIRLFYGLRLIDVLTLNSGIGIDVGTIALYFMTITVISSDLKYLFKINYSAKTWRIIHLLNYSLFPLLYIHALYLSTLIYNVITFYLFIGLLVATIIATIYKASIVIKARKKIKK